jgi:hypothetical protein
MAFSTERAADGFGNYVFCRTLSGFEGAANAAGGGDAGRLAIADLGFRIAEEGERINAKGQRIKVLDPKHIALIIAIFLLL